MWYKVLALMALAMMAGCERERPTAAPAPPPATAPAPEPEPLSEQELTARRKAQRRATTKLHQARFEANLWAITPEAEHPLLEGCQARQAAPCLQLGDAASARPHPLQGELSVEAYKLACVLSDGRGCRRYGEQLELGRGPLPNMKISLAFYRQGCKLGDALACEVYDVMGPQGKGEPKLLAKLVKALTVSCEAGLEPMSCARAGSMMLREADAKSSERAQALLTRGCELGAFSACNNLGSTLERAAAGDASDQRAVALFTRACDAGEAEGCYNLGWMVQKGRGAARDEARASALASLACERGYAAACSGGVDRAAP